MDGGSSSSVQPSYAENLSRVGEGNWSADLNATLMAYLVLVPHGAPAQNGHFCHRVLLQSLQGVAFGSEQLPHEVKLQRNKQQCDVLFLHCGTSQRHVLTSLTT
jgi:hypothetical protein